MEKIAPGRYIVAVSGGVDSMALLDMLRRRPDLQLVVAHVDHGVRSDSHKDAELVMAYAEKYGLVYKSTLLKLGSQASEATARTARYDFLQQCCKKEHAAGIILAHHQDDMSETALLAILRGTGWRGIAPFTRVTNVLRPLLNLRKDQLIGYARRHNIPWREDSTNTNERYTRNYIRHTIWPLLDQKDVQWETKFLRHIRKQRTLRQQIENELNQWLAANATITSATISLPRYPVIMVPSSVAYELLQHAFVRLTGNTVPQNLAQAALLFTKVAKPGKVLEISATWQLRAESANVIVEPRHPMVSLREH